VTKLAAIVFAVLALATFGAFFVAQRLKHNPAVVQDFHRSPAAFSPNNDGRLDSERITFAVKQPDDVTVDIVDHTGEPIRRLVSDRHLAAYRKIPTLRWNGKTDAGKLAPDGIYRVRVILRSQDRSVTVPKSFALDTTPPTPEVLGVGAKGNAGPEVLDVDGAGTDIHVYAPGHHRIVTIYRTDVTPARVVRVLPIGDRAPAATVVHWDGTDASGKPVAAGTYLAGIQARDRAGNRGASPPLDRAGLPIVRYGHHVPGHGGIRVSDLVVQPPLTPVQTGQAARFFIDAHGRDYRWSVRRLGGSHVIAAGGGHGAILSVPGPRGSSGIYLLTVHSHRTTMRVPFEVNGPSIAGTPVDRQGVLVVLPAISWQGRNRIDSDGDGEPDTLYGGVAVALDRGFSGDGLPENFAHGEANAVAGLDRKHRRYDITTDLALAQGTGPRLTDYRGVLLAGDEVWVTRDLGARLRAFVRRGGTLVSLGTNSLMREVKINAHDKLVHPTPRAATDLFGARILPVVTKPVTLTNFRTPASLGLFTGTVGQFTGYFHYEPTASLGTQLSLAADAVDEVGRPVIVAAHFGRGLVIRVGLPDFASSLIASPQTAQLYNRLWTLLSR
jgi:hypothetical protein